MTTPVTDWNALPLTLTWEEVGAAIRVDGYHAVRRAIERGDLPTPTMTRPMRWSRAELQRHLGFPVPVESAKRK